MADDKPGNPPGPELSDALAYIKEKYKNISFKSLKAYHWTDGILSVFFFVQETITPESTHSETNKYVAYAFYHNSLKLPLAELVVSYKITPQTGLWSGKFEGKPVYGDVVKSVPAQSYTNLLTLDYTVTRSGLSLDPNQYDEPFTDKIYITPSYLVDHHLGEIVNTPVIQAVNPKS